VIHVDPYPTPDGLVVSPNATAFGSNPAATPQELENGLFWGRYLLRTQLPNVGNINGVAVTGVNAASPPAYTKLAPGDLAFVQGSDPPGSSGMYVCVNRGTPAGSDAQWNSVEGSASFSNISLDTIHTGTAPLVIGAVWLVAGRVLHQESHALIGVQTTGTATMRLRRQSTGTLLAGAEWIRNATLGDQAMAADVTVANTDWYTIELLGDDPATVSLAYGLQLL
jgi:hypothetical protein